MVITTPSSKVLVLFDVDGTLTESRMVVNEEMKQVLAELKTKVDVGIVGGSDFKKIKEQLGGSDITREFNYIFSENGLVAYKGTNLIHRASFIEEITEAKYQELVDFCLVYIAGLRLPKKRGTFIEYRSGMVNISPIGRDCTHEERIEFYEFDKVHAIREKMVAAIKARFPDLNLTLSIGGQISIDAFPNGWDKRFCLQFVVPENYEKIYFFGDKTYPGGNDHEIFSSPLVIGSTVTSPADTIKQLKALFSLTQ